MARQIINPRWGNREKTHIICGFRYDDGREMVASVSNIEGEAPNPDWAEIMNTYGVDGVDKNSQEALASHIKRKQIRLERTAIENERKQKEDLFNIKAEVFDMDVVRNSSNRDIKNKIRRAGSATEVLVYASVLHMLEDPIVAATANSNTETTNI